MEEVAPLMICELKNSFDSDGAAIIEIENDEAISILDDTDEGQLQNVYQDAAVQVRKRKVVRRKPSDYARTEAILRIKQLEIKKKQEDLKLKTELRRQVLKKRTAMLEEERNRKLLKEAQLKLETLKKRLGLLVNWSKN